MSVLSEMWVDTMTLAQIALQMRREARAGRRTKRPLPHGLHLTLWRDGDDWILSLTRKNVAASAKEVDVCREKFEIPAEASVEGPEEIKGYHVTRIRWSEAKPEQTSFVEPRESYYRESL